MSEEKRLPPVHVLADLPAGAWPSVIVVGAGVFGLSAALEMRSRGYVVDLFDAIEFGHVDGASNDVNRIIRADYGEDFLYTELAEEAIQKWREWNKEFGKTVYHESGLLVLSSTALNENKDGDKFSFKQSFQIMKDRGYDLLRINKDVLGMKFPAWSQSSYIDGFFNPTAGWVECAATLSILREKCSQIGISLHENSPLEELIISSQNQIQGIITKDNLRKHYADIVILATGAWTPSLLPELQSSVWPCRQHVLYLKPSSPQAFQQEKFPPFVADLSTKGFYGFPSTEEGTVKIGRHATTREGDEHPSDSRQLKPHEISHIETLIASSFPSLHLKTKNAVNINYSIEEARACFYCMTFDGDFWIDHHPNITGLIVACGGSGHSAKFLPVLGRIIADIVEGRDGPYARRFRWRNKKGNSKL